MSLVEISVALLVGGALFIVYLFYRFCYAPYQLFKKCGIKGPTPTVFTGNYYDIKDKNIRERNEFLANKYGPVTGYYLGRRPRIIITDLDMLKQILVKDFDNFTDHTPIPNLLAEAKTLLTSEGEKWKAVRRTLTPSFSASKLKMMLPLLKTSTDNLVAVLGEKATSGESFDALKIFNSFTMETILATAFGRRVNVLSGESSELSEQIEIIISGVIDGQFDGIFMLESKDMVSCHLGLIDS